MKKNCLLVCCFSCFFLHAVAQKAQKLPECANELEAITELPHDSINQAVARLMVSCSEINNHIKPILSWVGASAKTHRKNGKYSKDIPYRLIGTAIFTHKSFQEPWRTGHSHYILGEAYLGAGIYNKAEQNFIKGINMLKAHGLTHKNAEKRKTYSRIIGLCYYQIALACRGLNDIGRGLGNCEDALNWLTTENDIALVFLLQGALNSKYKKPMKALDSYEKAKQIYAELGLAVEEAICLQNLGKVYQDLQEWEKAMDSYEKGLRLYQRIDTSKTIHKKTLANMLIGRGVAHKYLRQYKMSHRDFEKVFRLRSQIDPSHKSPEFAFIYDNQGDVYLLEKKFEKALTQYQLAILQLIPEFEREELLGDPGKMDTLQLLGETSSILVYLTDKAKALEVFAENTESATSKKACQQEALQLYHLADRLIFRMRKGQRADESKLFWSTYTRPFYEKAIRLCIKLDKLPLAFEFLERSKASLLLAAAREAQAKHQAGLSDHIIEKEQTLRDSIAYYENQLTLLFAAKESDPEATTLYQQRLRNWRSKFDQFVDELEQDHPKYYQNKHLNTVASLENVQAFLQKQKTDTTETAMLEYFEGDSGLFVFYIDSGRAWAGEVEMDTALLNTFLYSVSQASEVTTYIEKGNDLYNLLLGSLDQAIELPRNLIIIPDGSLSKIPFEALLKKPTPEVNDIKSHVLLMHHRCSYAFSASVLLHSLAGEEKFGKNVLSVAPVTFDAGYPALAGTDLEAQKIVDLLGGEPLVNGKATRAGFLEMAAQSFQVLHLYTHAKADSLQPYIVFRDSSLLFLSDIYAMRTKALLVVLGACETIKGKVKKGEGVMSLARAFRYIGLSSVVASLWECEVSPTQFILANFYKNLKKEMRKDEALHQAKLLYLKKGRLEPCFWAAFVHVGDPAEMSFARSGIGFWKWGLLVVLVFGLWYFLPLAKLK